ncbi:MAG: WbqC family protein [Sphingobacteriaceae bacterium]|nr:WbqC family protein [Sphingobacteriaceae bacterium]
MAKSDIFVILDNVDFQQGNHSSITNRTKVKCNGEEKFLTVPVKKNDQSKLIKDIKIDKQQNCFKKHARTIQQNYAKASHFKESFPMIEQLMMECSAFEMMAEANTHVIKTVSSWLNLNPSFVTASSLPIDVEDRNERIIKICNNLGSSIYLSGNGGRKYHDESLFAASGITIKYTDFKVREYSQVGASFIPGLSIADMILNCGLIETKKLIIGE